MSKGAYAKAEPLFLRALAIREKALGADHPDAAISLNKLAELYRNQGAYAKAEPLFLRALAIWEKALGADHPNSATSLSSLALLYQSQGFYGKAEPLYLRALAILEKALGAEHATTAFSLNNLGGLYYEQGAYAKAEPLYLRSLAIREKALVPDHPDLAINLNNLALLYYSQGAYAKAEPLYLLSLAITKKALGPDHPNTARSLNNLALLYRSQGAYTKAGPLLRRGIAAQSRFLQEQLPLLPQSARQAQIQALDAAWEVAFTGAERSPSAAELALFSRLNRYGLLLDIEQRQALLSRASSPTRQMAQEIAALTSQLADVRLSAPQRQALAARRDGLEQELYRQLPALKPQIVEPTQLAKELPVGAALVEFQRYRPFDGRQQPEQRWGPPRYLALVLTREGTTRAVDLGAAAPLDALIAKALATTEEKEEKREQGANPMALWQEVSAQIFPPALLQLLGGSKQWIVAPDGELSRIPYTALPSPQDPKRLLADAVALRLITSGRSLVPPATPSSSAPSTRPLVLANPDYGPAPAGTTPWRPLAWSKDEGRWIRNLLNSTYYEQAEATTSRLSTAQAPRVLHVASHGYYAGASSQPAPRAPVPLTFADGWTRSAFAGLPTAREDAMLNSAIVLAGANHYLRPGSLPAVPASSAGSADADDGYLTAKEAAQLQLAGTELVVLSACDTLAGAQQSGEGLYGLQRALNAAGARSTLLSLWKVDDQATYGFMQRYYELLKQGKGRMEALLAVQQEFRTNPELGRWSDPRYWAAWQLVGETGPIQGL
jgi:CHAT domain-containing protein